MFSLQTALQTGPKASLKRADTLNFLLGWGGILC